MSCSEQKAEGQETGLNSPESETVTNEWQLVDDLNISQCGSSPRSLSQLDYNSELDDLMSAVEEFTSGLSQPEEETALAVPPADHADLAPEGPLQEADPHTAELELPTSTHTARSSSPSLSEVPSAGLSTLSLDSFSIGDNSPPVSKRGSGSESSVEEIQEAISQALIKNISSSVEAPIGPSVPPADSPTVTSTIQSPPSPKPNSADDLGRSQDLAGRAHSARQFWSARGLPDRAQWAQYNAGKASVWARAPNSTLIGRMLSALKAYIEAAGMFIPSAIRSRVAALTSSIRLHGSGRRGFGNHTSTFCLTASLVSVSALLLWSVSKNRSLSRQLTQSQMDLEHHVMTILNLNDKMSRGLDLPVLQRCSYSSQPRMYSIPVRPFALSSGVL